MPRLDNLYRKKHIRLIPIRGVIMLDLSNAEIKFMIIHIIGNKMRQEGLRLSKECILLEDSDFKELMFRHFLKPFLKTEFLYRFTHTSNLDFNENYVYSKNIFTNIQTFYDQSSNIARHLYENSTHPRIRSGEFFMLYITNCNIDGNTTDAIGLFKAETKETFIMVTENDDAFNIKTDEGIGINRLDKGCLIFNLAQDDGYRIAVIDNHSKANEEARYWKDQFLKVSTVQNSEAVTQKYIDLCNKVIETTNTFENAGEKLDRKSRAIDYFKSNEVFNLEHFAEQVFDKNQEALNDFSKLRTTMQETSELQLPDHFDISRRTVDKQTNRTKNVIRLDRTFDIYIKGQPSNALRNLERSYDSKRNMNFYKIYFHEEQ